MTASSMASTDAINLAGMVDDSIVDGPGIRFVFFAQGCPHRCAGCHNPATHTFGVGVDYAVDELYNRVKKNPLVKGVTFSGGEPFAQAEGFSVLARRLRADGYELAAYTGYCYEQLAAGSAVQQELLLLLDILVDGEFTLERRNLDLRWRGSENQRVLDIQQSLRNGAATLAADPRWV